MKKFFTIVSVAVLGLGLVACNDFLDIPSQTKFDSASIFQTEGRAEMAVLAAYPAGYNREMWYQLGMGTDEVISTEGLTNSKNQIGNYLLSGSITGSSTYTASYAAIEYANVCIQGLPTMEQTPKVKQLLGESLCIRAMAYLNLVRYWGDVPYTRVPVATLSTFESSRESRDLILDDMVKDLQDAIELLPWKSEITNFTPERYCKEAAYALLARVALYNAGYSLRWDLDSYSESSLKVAKRSDAARVKELNKIAMDACKAVMNRGSFSLSADYKQIFIDLVNGAYNKESILEQGQFGTNCNVETGYTNGAFCHTSSLYGKSQPAMKINPALYFEYGEDDLRRDVAICTYAVDNNGNIHLHPYGGFYIGKFRPSWKTSIGTATNKRDINWPWFRYSHILLMYAEADNEYNGAPSAEAQNALKAIRTRAYGGDASKVGTIPTTHDEFLKAIILENKLEFAGEAWRRTELARWGVLRETLLANKEQIKQIASHTGAYANYDRYRIYTPVAGVFGFSDATIPFESVKKEQLNKEEIDAYKAAGKTVLDMNDSVVAANTDSANQMGGFETVDGLKVFKGAEGLDDISWYASLFRGLRTIGSELCPLSQTSVIDVNPGLKDQQLPGY
ncbi:MAG: RagB/SusD family nutrient uptake outer membrane protein [Bacteroidales bacterium]|nr:RagB/SusD family nutrient uptake outer membrane protein [Bacteroidales bacterium]